MAGWSVHHRVATGATAERMRTGVDAVADIRLDLGDAQGDGTLRGLVGQHGAEQARADLEGRRREELPRGGGQRGTGH